MSSGDPTISSLDEHQVHLSDELRLHLSSQYKGLYEHHVEKGAESRHLDRVLSVMKTPPSITTCRVNLILSNPKEVVEGLKDVLLDWRNRNAELWEGERGPARKESVVTVSNHTLLSDLVCIGSTHDSDTHFGLSQYRVPPRCASEEQKVIFEHSERRAKKGWPLDRRVVICDRFCGEAVLRGSDIFVRGVICADSGVKPQEVVAVYADVTEGCHVPRGLMVENYGGTCVLLGLGKACCRRADMFNTKKGVAVQMSSEAKDRAGKPMPPLHGVMSGKMMLQNLPSMIVAHALQPRQGDTILDMCSAPGGKTCHVASLVSNNATIVACDKSRKKMVLARDLFMRMGATCVTPLALDSTACLKRNIGSRSSVQEILSCSTASGKDGLLNVTAFFPESFDRIILDPPCSALGLRPKLMIGSTRTRDLENHALYQRLFVREAVCLLKRGGTMTYSTCTINASENELMVRHILDEYPTMKLLPIEIGLGLPGLPGVGLDEHERSMVRRFDPTDSADTVGFFIAKFVKSDG